jgi:hypothetical protein
MHALLLLLALSNGAPNLPIDKICASAKDAALQEDKKGSYDACVRDESSARDTLRQQWRQFPASVHADCTFSAGITESYVEMLTCMQMESGKGFGPPASNGLSTGTKLTPAGGKLQDGQPAP